MRDFLEISHTDERAAPLVNTTNMIVRDKFDVATHIASLTESGYCHIPGVFTADQVARAKRLLDELLVKSRDTLTDKIPPLNCNQHMVFNLENKDFYFLEMLFASQGVHQILMHFLNDKYYRAIPQQEPNYILRSFLGRSSNEMLPLHIDSFLPYLSNDESIIVQAAVVLEDQDEENGCTVIMPGSHRSCQYADRSQYDSCTPILSKAGDVVLWDSRLWHGTLPNRSKTRTRWAIIGTFSRWWIKQNSNVTENLPQVFYDKLTDSQKAVLGFCSLPYSTERDGMDLREGYSALLPRVADYAQSKSYHP